jgi:hypothetical protein
VGESSVEQMGCPALRLQQPVEALTEAVYRERLSFGSRQEYTPVMTVRGYGASE